MTLPKNCPKCSADLEGEDIYNSYLKDGYAPEEAEEKAAFYGWTKESPVRFSRVEGIYDWDLDRTSQWKCPDCGHIWDAIWKRKR